MASSYSQLEAKLRQAWLKDIARIAAGGVTRTVVVGTPGGGGSSGGAMLEHDLDSALHGDSLLPWTRLSGFPAILADAPLRIDGGSAADLAGSRTLSLPLGQGLEVMDELLRVKLPVNSGLLRTASGIAVNLDAEGGLELSSNALRVKLAAPAYLTRTSDGLALAKHPILDLHTVSAAPFDLVGATATNTLGMLTPSADPGPGAAVLRSDASGHLTLVRLMATEQVQTPVVTTAVGDLALTPTTGITTLNALHASTRLRSPLIDTATGSLRLSPATHIELNPGSNLVTLLPGKVMQSDNYASQTTGMRITHLGEGDFRYLYADELHAKAFVADIEQALAGGQIIAKSVAVLDEDFTAPAAGSAAWLTVKSLPSAPNMDVFAAGDFLRIRTFARAGGGLSITDCWGTVRKLAGEPLYTTNALGERVQRWHFTRSSGSIGGAQPPGAMAAGAVVPAGTLILDYGQSGNGYYEVNAIDGIYGLNSPYAQVVTWTGHPATGRVVNARFGNLRGIFGVANEYGLYLGTGASDADAYIRMGTYGAGNRFNNLPLEWWADGTQSIRINTALGMRVRVRNAYEEHRGYGLEGVSGALIGGVFAAEAGAVRTLRFGGFTLGQQSDVGLITNELGNWLRLAARKTLEPASVLHMRTAADATNGMPEQDSHFKVDANRMRFGMDANSTFAHTGLMTVGSELTVGGAAVLLKGARINRSPALTLTAGWKRIGYFHAAGGNRGHVRISIINGGGATTPYVTTIEAYHSYTLGTSSLHVWDSANSRVSAVRITHNGTTAFVEAEFTVAHDSVFYKQETGGWDDPGSYAFTLYQTSVTGGGTVECQVECNGGYSTTGWLRAARGIFSGALGADGEIYSAAAITAATAITAGGAITAGTTVNASPGSWGTGYRFTGAAAGIIGHPNYLILERDGGALLSFRFDALTSALNFGYGNANAAAAQLTFMTGGDNTLTAFVQKLAGIDGPFELRNYGTGDMILRQLHAGRMGFYTGNTVRMTITADGLVGIGTAAPGARLDVNGFIKGTGIFVDADPGNGGAGTVGLSNVTLTASGAGVGTLKMNGATSRTNNLWLKIYIGATAYWIPGWIAT